MAQHRTLTPGYEVTYPNREKASSHVARVLVALILFVSVALIAAITIGGWSKLQGLKPLNVVWCISYVLMGIYILRWARGLLPIAAALAMMMLLISLIAGAGLSGTSWFDRSSTGYVAAQSIFGGTGFSSDTLGLLTVLVAPVQLLLIITAMQAFSQGWNVELEAPIDRERRPQRGGAKPRAAATA